MPEQLTADDIKALRRDLNITQQQLAERLHIALRTVARWEAGETVPTGYLLYALHDLKRKSARKPPQ